MKKIVFLIMLTSLMSCDVQLPLTWSTNRDAYPNGFPGENITPGTPAMRQAELPFSFSEVFASGEKALSFAQINVTETNESLGTIYGGRSVLVRGFTHKYYYMLKITEKSAEKCNVTLYSKKQESRIKFKWLTYVVIPSILMAAGGVAIFPDELGYAAAFAAIWPGVSIPLTLGQNIGAKKGSILKWSDDDDEYLDRIMSFIRTDLLQK